MSKRIITLGEIMLRLKSPGFEIPEMKKYPRLFTCDCHDLQRGIIKFCLMM